MRTDRVTLALLALLALALATVPVHAQTIRIDPQRAALLFDDPPAADEVASFSVELLAGSNPVPIATAMDLPLASATLVGTDRRIALTALDGFAGLVATSPDFTIRVTFKNGFGTSGPTASNPFVRGAAPGVPTRTRVVPQ